MYESQEEAKKKAEDEKTSSPISANSNQLKANYSIKIYQLLIKLFQSKETYPEIFKLYGEKFVNFILMGTMNQNTPNL